MCGHKQRIVARELSEMRVETCDTEEGGCGKDFVLDLICKAWVREMYILRPVDWTLKEERK